MESSTKCSLGCSYCTITEKLQEYTDLKEELIRYMATEYGLYNTINTIQNGYYSKQITQELKTAQSLPFSKYSNAEDCNT